MIDYDDASVGTRLRQIRQARGKSLRVVAGLAGISYSHLSRLESGERSLDRRSVIAALADVLQVSPMDILGTPIPTNGDGTTDTSIDGIRHAVQAVTMGVPDGQLQPVDQLLARMRTALSAAQHCRYAELGLALPGLIRDLHTTLDAGRGDTELLRMTTVFHQQATGGYLHTVSAPGDLCWQAVCLGRDAAQHLDEPVPLGITAWGAANSLLTFSSLDLATKALDTAPASTGDEQLDGMLSLTRSLVAAATGRTADVDGPLEHAADLAGRTGEGNNHFMSFGPTNVTLWRMSVALESGDHERAAALADTVVESRIPAPKRRAHFHINTARALAGVRHRDKAVMALRRAEQISPQSVTRGPIARSLLAELVARAKRDAVGRELRGMAYRAGLPV